MWHTSNFTLQSCSADFKLAMYTYIAYVGLLEVYYTSTLLLEVYYTSSILLTYQPLVAQLQQFMF